MQIYKIVQQINEVSYKGFKFAFSTSPEASGSLLRNEWS